MTLYLIRFVYKYLLTTQVLNTHHTPNNQRKKCKERKWNEDEQYF